MTRSSAALARIDLLQFHGSEPEDFCASFGRPYLKAFAVCEGFSIYYNRQFSTPPHQPSCWTRRALDTAAVERPSIAASQHAKHRKRARASVVLSGGFDCTANVATALSAVVPFAVDVSSDGVEVSRGQKSTDLINSFAMLYTRLMSPALDADCRRFRAD